jgi:hypothetical protein
MQGMGIKIKVFCLTVILNSYSVLHNNVLPATGIIRDRVGTMIVNGTYVGTFEMDYLVQTEGNISSVPACKRNREDNQIKAEEKIIKWKNVRRKTEGKKSNKYLDILRHKTFNCNCIQN